MDVLHDALGKRNSSGGKLKAIDVLLSLLLLLSSSSSSPMMNMMMILSLVDIPHFGL